MLVRDVLKAKGRKVIFVGTETTIQEALALFVEHNIGSLPVVDADGLLVGIFTERDVLFGLHGNCEAFHRHRIGDKMTPNPVTCTPEDKVHEVMGMMSRHQVGQLPVVSGTDLVGVVSVGDLIKAMYEKVEAENQYLINYVQGQA